MNITVSSTLIQLQGDWSVNGLTRHSMDTLARALQQIEPHKTKKLPIDCQDVTAMDNIGQQLLYGWMDIVRLRGVEPELVNMPDKVEKKIDIFR